MLKSRTPWKLGTLRIVLTRLFKDRPSLVPLRRIVIFFHKSSSKMPHVGGGSSNGRVFPSRCGLRVEGSIFFIYMLTSFSNPVPICTKFMYFFLGSIPSIFRKHPTICSSELKKTV